MSEYLDTSITCRGRKILMEWRGTDDPDAVQSFINQLWGPIAQWTGDQSPPSCPSPLVVLHVVPGPDPICEAAREGHALGKAAALKSAAMPDRLFDPAPAKPPYTPEENAAYFREVVRIFEDAGIHLPGWPTPAPEPKKPPLAPARNECGECRFWIRTDFLADGNGSCHRMPPDVLVDPEPRSASYYRSQSPLVHLESWCGEFKRRDTP